MNREDRAAKLLQAGMVLASQLSLATVLQRIVELAVELTDAHYGAVGVLGSGEERIAEFITTGISDEARALIGHIPHGRGVLGQLIDDPRPLRLPRISDHPSSSGFPPNHPPMTTFLGAPMMARGRVSGNIYLTEKSMGQEFTLADEDALVVLAAQASVAVANARAFEESERRRRSLEAVSELSDRIISGDDTARVLEAVAANARELVHADLSMIVGRPQGAGAASVMVADGHAAEELRGMTVPADSSIAGEVMRTGRPIVVEDASAQAHAYEPGHLADMGPTIFVPLRLRGQVFGTLSVANRRRGQAFTADDVALVQTFANQASVALENGSAKEDRERLSLLDERERIGRELHEGVIQSLLAVGMSLQGTAVASTDEETRRRLDGAVEELDRAIHDLRNYIFGLRPVILADHQLGTALQELVQEFSEASGVVTVAEVETPAASVLSNVSADVVQLVREALSNVRKHAEASTCRVSLRLEGDAAILEIDDDGGGFDPTTVLKGLGLDNLRKRAQRLGGEGKIDSVPGEGTVVSVRLPVKPDVIGAGVSGIATMTESEKELRVMLVDDHEVVRDGVKSLLQAAGGMLVVAEAATVREAVANADRSCPDVIVMGVRLAGGSGIEATREIKSRRPDTAVLMLTSFAADDALFASIMAGAAGYVLKQIKGDDLVRAVRAVGRGESLLDLAVTGSVLARLRKGKHLVEDEKLSRLSAQEERILVLVADGKTNKEIGEAMHLTEKTVKNYVTSVFNKLEVARRAEAAAYLVTHRRVPGT